MTQEVILTSNNTKTNKETDFSVNYNLKTVKNMKFGKIDTFYDIGSHSNLK